MKINQIKIKTAKGIKLIGPGQPCFIVAEMSCNHLQSYKRALKIIDVAAAAGADAIKVQTYTPDTITINSDKKYFQIKVNRDWRGRTLYDLYKKAYMPWAWQPKLKKYAEKRGLIFFSFPLDITAVDFLKKMKVELYKVGSFEVVDIPLLKRIGRIKKPVIISRGMSTLPELKLAIKTLKRSGSKNIGILHCLSAYPADASKMNLRLIPKLIKKFKVPVGLSDHSLSNDPAIAAVSLGASIIEKHLTAKRGDGGFDASFSLEPNEFKKLVKSIRDIESSLSGADFKATKQEKENLVFRRSLFVVKNIKKGEKFTPANVNSIRPGYGLAPKYLDKIIGKVAKKDIERGEPLSWKMIK